MSMNITDRIKSFGESLIQGLAHGAYATDGYLGWYPLDRLEEDRQPSGQETEGAAARSTSGQRPGAAMRGMGRDPLMATHSVLRAGR